MKKQINLSKEIPIFFAMDDNYAKFSSVALNSAVRNCSKNRNYRAIFLCENVSEKNKKKLKKLEKSNFKVEFVEMQKGLEAITNRGSNCMRVDFFTLTIYFRLFIAAMFPQYDKGIYLDGDIAILDDIANLYDIDIGDNYVGACRDSSIVGVPEIVKYTEEVVGTKDYINSGVLLLNLKELRQRELDKKFLDLLTTYHFDSIAPDQDYINSMCKGKIYFIPGEWDAMPEVVETDCEKLEDPKLVHYNLFSKPWIHDGIQYEEHFWKYAKKSGYYRQIKHYKKNYPIENKENEINLLKGMCDKATRIINTDDITMKKIENSGVKIII